MMSAQGPWGRLLADPLLHMLLIVVGLVCVALWRSSSQAVGYDPISDARVIYTRHDFRPVPVPLQPARLNPPRAG
jgi:hypothetical protein